MADESGKKSEEKKNHKITIAIKNNLIGYCNFKLTRIKLLENYKNEKKLANLY